MADARFRSACALVLPMRSLLYILYIAAPVMAYALGAHGFSLRQIMTQPILHHRDYFFKAVFSVFFTQAEALRPQCMRPCSSLVFRDSIHNTLPPMRASALGAHGFSLRQIMTQPILHYRDYFFKAVFSVFFTQAEALRKRTCALVLPMRCFL